ncbi:MAG TPA: hypothetical protein VLA43_10400 [Longimicrobiales bacterium]|nr:hypothetical protein [Longimicrobiales bacterium]
MSSAPRRRSASAGPTRFIIGFFLLLAAVYTAFGVRAWLRNQRTLEAIEALRGEVLAARTAADACTSELALAESVFRQQDAEVDSLRRVVDAAEAPLPGGGRGVPAEGYDAYLESFQEYNAAVGEWEAQVEGIREREEACRGLVERHNVLADSLREVLEENGILLP